MKLYLFLLSVILTSCGKFRDGSSVWQGGLWILPWATFLACVFFGYKTYIDWQSGWQRDELNVGHTEGKEKLPLYKIPYLYFTIGFLIATIAIIWMVNAEK